MQRRVGSVLVKGLQRAAAIARRFARRAADRGEFAVVLSGESIKVLAHIAGSPW